MAPEAAGGSWRPILEGALAERAREAIDAIAEALPSTFSTPGPATQPPRALPDPSLCGGRAGLYPGLAPG